MHAAKQEDLKTQMKKLLVIEDDTQFREFMKEALTSKGYEVILASGGVEGLLCISEHSPDLVITDIVMPEMEGVEVLMELKSKHKDLPVIAMSSYNMGNADSYLRIALTLGASAVLSKPFHIVELVTEIENSLPS